MDDISPELRRPLSTRTPGAGRLARAFPPRALVAVAVLALFAVAGLLTATAGPKADPGRLDHTYGSPEALAEDILTALARGDRQALAELPLSEREFRHVVWPELPASRSIPVDYVWGELSQKSDMGLRRMVTQLGGQHFELVGVRFAGERSSHESFVVHRRARLDVRDASGHTRQLAILGSVLERDGQFKLFSYNVSR
jgi:hypothetical protein